MTPNPSTDVQLRTHVFTTPMREFGSEGKHWSPCASTLVTGETEAVLTDTGHIKSDVSALTDPPKWQKWIDSIDLVENLGAKRIIAGHKQPDASDEDLETILDGSRGYIRDFRDAVAASSTADEVVETMKTKYEGYANLTTLEFSARAAFPAG